MNFRKMLIGNARKAMLDNIEVLDKKTLQKELESYLKLEFEYKDEIERLNNIIEEYEKFLISVKQFAYLNKLKELKEGKEND